MADRTLTVKIIGDSKSLERAFDRSNRSAKGFQAQVVGINRGMAGLAAATGATIGLAAFFDQAKRSVQAASNLNEQINKSNVVFGRSAESVRAWSKTTADAFGVSQRAALEAASGFGQILETSGLNQQRAAAMSRSLVELASDLASFNNIDPSDALDKLRSGLAGEAEPLRRVGVLLSEARVKQEAYRLGIARAGATLTEGQKVQARYSLILKDTATAEGDFARTSDSLANKQRTLSARVEELQARLGQDLVPVLGNVIDKLLAGEDAARRFKQGLDRLPGGGRFRLVDILPGGADFKLSDVTKHLPGGNKSLLELLGLVPAKTEKVRIPIDVEFDVTKTLTKGLRGRGGVNAFGQPGFVPGGSPPVPIIPAERINRIFDEKIARELFRSANDTLPNQIRALDKIEAQLTREISRVKDVTRKENLRDQLIAAQRQEDAVRAQIKQNQENARLLAAQQEQERIEAAREALARRAAARKAAQFKALGLTAEGQPREASAKQLLARTNNLAEQIKGTFLDTDKTRSILGRIRKVLGDGTKGIARDVRSAIHGMLADLDQQLRDHTNNATATRFHKANVTAILRSAGLSPEQVKALSFRLAQVGQGGTVHAAGIGAFGTIVVEHRTELDGQVIERSTTKHQQKRRRRNPPQKRGSISP